MDRIISASTYCWFSYWVYYDWSVAVMDLEDGCFVSAAVVTVLLAIAWWSFVVWAIYSLVTHITGG